MPNYRNLLVTRTLSKAHSLAGFRVGYAVLPEAIADDLNAHNDAYPLARPSQAAAIATLETRTRSARGDSDLRGWTERLRRGCAARRAQPIRARPISSWRTSRRTTRAALARALAERGILVKPLGDARLGRVTMRVTTALPEDNARFVAALRELL